MRSSARGVSINFEKKRSSEKRLPSLIVRTDCVVPILRRPDRPFPIDMAGFAVGTKYGSCRAAHDVLALASSRQPLPSSETAAPILTAKPPLPRYLSRAGEAILFSAESKRGYQESDFLTQIVPEISDVEVYVSDAEVLVWHTKTASPLLNREANAPSDPSIEV